MQLYAALEGGHNASAVRDGAKKLAQQLQAEHPDLVVSDMKRAIRGGKVLLDWSQNSEAKTTIAPYSLRGRDRAFVATPRTWNEVEAGGMTQVHRTEIPERLERYGDLMAALRS
jgi:bifunctional non-homologous end joining protein LigD